MKKEEILRILIDFREWWINETGGDAMHPEKNDIERFLKSINTEVQQQEIKTAEGKAVSGDDTHWAVNCPNCDKEYEYKGYFDNSDKTICKCGCIFTTSKIWIDEKNCIE